MDVLVFSKDRGFQLFTLLETLINNVSGIDNIIVQFSYSNKDFLKGYEILNSYFSNVSFIDETKYGFYQTIMAVLDSEILSKNLFMEVDDVIYYDTVDLNEMNEIFNKYDTASKLSVSLDSSIFNSKYYDAQNKHILVDRTKHIENNIQDLVLKYPFNVSGTIHRKQELIKLLATGIINNPIELEIAGSSSNIFKSHQYAVYHDKEVCKQMHTNNTLKRYDELFTTEHLNSLLLNNEVLSFDDFNFHSVEYDMRWFNGENIGRFPIFPWEIPPTYHESIINKRKPLLP